MGIRKIAADINGNMLIFLHQVWWWLFARDNIFKNYIKEVAIYFISGF